MTKTTPPMRWQWDGEHLIPKTPRLADRYLVIGQEYRLVEEHERSMASHRHYFACINEAFKNLPEDLQEKYHSEEGMRKDALIRCGFFTQNDVVCESKAEAQRVATLARRLSEYAVITIRGNVVSIYEAKSQSVRAMPPKEFAESKQAVLDYLAGLVGVTTAELEKNAGASA